MARNVATMEEERIAFNILTGNPTGKETSRRPGVDGG